MNLRSPSRVSDQKRWIIVKKSIQESIDLGGGGRFADPELGRIEGLDDGWVHMLQDKAQDKCPSFRERIFFIPGLLGWGGSWPCYSNLIDDHRSDGSVVPINHVNKLHAIVGELEILPGIIQGLCAGRRGPGNRQDQAEGHQDGRHTKSQGAGSGATACCSPKCAAPKTVPTENRSVSKLFRWRDEELPHLACQIVGCEPERMAAAAQRIEAEGFFGVDVNFGCATATICRRSCGAAVLREPDLAARIIDRIRRAVCIPVTVKFRTGWQDDPAAAVDMGRRFESGGADAVTLHPRVAPDRRARPPKWEYIARLKQALRIPVFGNGNVFDAAGCLRMLRQTGCDGVALGRIAIARPWTFADWTEGIKTRPNIFESTAARFLELII